MIVTIPFSGLGRAPQSINSTEEKVSARMPICLHIVTCKYACNKMIPGFHLVRVGGDGDTFLHKQKLIKKPLDGLSEDSKFSEFSGGGGDILAVAMLAHSCAYTCLLGRAVLPPPSPKVYP